LLGLPQPAYFHHRLVTHDDGRRLAKRDLAPTLQALRDAGIDGPELARQLLSGRLPLGFRLSEA
jgi:glutamyl-Q tRNA(Asp) synthetase